MSYKKSQLQKDMVITEKLVGHPPARRSGLLLIVETLKAYPTDS